MTNSINGTPLTNRGVANTLNSVQNLDNKGLDGKYPNGLKNFILIDWFQATILDMNYDIDYTSGEVRGALSVRHDVVDLFEKLFGIDPTQLVFEYVGVNGYNANYHYENIYIMWNTSRPEMGVHIKMSGQGCRDFESLELDYIDFFRKINTHYINYNRIDISIDQFNDDYFTLPKLEYYIRNNLVCSKFRSALNIEKINLSKKDDSLGHTIQFGSKASNIQVTFYDKLKERQSKNIEVLQNLKFWTRTEVRYRHECCKQVINLLLTSNEYNTLNDIIKSTLRDYISFKVNNSNDSNLSRRPEVEWWYLFLENINYLEITNYLPESSITKKANWLDKSCARSNFIVYLSKLDNLKTDDMTDMYLIKFLQKGSVNFNYNELQAINNYRISKKLEPFTISELKDYIGDLNELISQDH